MDHRHRLLFLVFMSVAIVAAADTENKGVPPPLSHDALNTLDTFETARTNAKMKYRRAIRDACQSAIAGLEKAKTTAMHANNLDEASRIQANIESLKNQYLEKTKTFEIDSQKDWQDTFQLQTGDEVSISASGKWCFDKYKQLFAGPDGVPKNDKERWAFLEGRIGDKVFPIGSKLDIKSSDPGILQLRINDEFLNDNEGSIEVHIQVK